MSSSTNVRFLAAGRASDRVLVASRDMGTAPGNVKATVALVLQHADVDERPRLSAADASGTVHYLYDSASGLILVVVTAAEYPQATAFKLLGEFASGFAAQFSAAAIGAAAEDALAKEANKQFLPDLVRRFDDVTQHSKVHAVQAEVDEATAVAGEVVDKMIAQQDSVAQIEDKAQDLSKEAKQFKSQSTGLKRAMYMRNLKLKIIIGLVIGALVLYVTIPLIIAATKDDEEDA